MAGYLKKGMKKKILSLWLATALVLTGCKDKGQDMENPAASVTPQLQDNEQNDTEKDNNDFKDNEQNDTKKDNNDSKNNEKENQNGLKNPQVMRDDITTMELVHEMELGINLGNTFESAGFRDRKSVV